MKEKKEDKIEGFDIDEIERRNIGVCFFAFSSKSNEARKKNIPVVFTQGDNIYEVVGDNEKVLIGTVPPKVEVKDKTIRLEL